MSRKTYGGLTEIKMNNQKDFFRVGRARISITDENHAIEKIKDSIHKGMKGYVCISNMRTVTIANKDDNYQDVMENSLMNTPDGMPLVWMARLWGLRNVQRTVGPELFKSMLLDSTNGIKHFLLGDTEETLKEVCRKYPNSNIVGTYSPPFCSIEKYDLEKMSRMINESRANIVWISMRAPKQDYLAQMLMPYIDKKVCIGVGAGFRFAIGQYKNPNIAIQKLGLTGFVWRKFNWQMVCGYIGFILSICKWGGQY